MAASHRITVSLTDDQNDEVSRIATAHGISKSEVLREIFRQFLADRARGETFNPKASLKGINHPRNHLSDVRGNPRADAWIEKHKDGQE